MIRDWDWKKAKDDLQLVSRVLGIKFEPTEIPGEGILKSDLLKFQPNRSNIGPLVQHLSKLLGRIKPYPLHLYPPSVLVPAQFILGHLLADLKPQRSLSQVLDCLHYHASADILQKSLLKLISEFSKIYRARLMINKVCASDFACNKLAQWHQRATSKENDNYFDDEREEYEKAYKLFELELSRGNND